MILLTKLVAIAWLSFLPYLVFFVLGFRQIRRKEQKQDQAAKSRHFLFQINTVGRSPKMVQNAIDSIHSHAYGSYEIWVVSEPGDRAKYQGAEKIVVPESFQTPNNTKYKARASQYAIEVRKKRSLISDKIWTIFLDDDNLFTRDYFQDILKIKPDSIGGQGILTMRNEYGRHIFSSLADNIRPSDCISFCSFFNSRGSPMHTHGEGLVVRSDVEAEIGWDFGDELIEDFIFGRKLSRKLPGKFEWLKGCIKLKSPLSVRDFLKQRRRWLWGFILYFSKMNKKEILWIFSRYIFSFLGFFALTGIAMDLMGYLQFHLPFARLILSFIAVGYFSYYQVGCFFNTKELKVGERIKWHFLQLIFQWPISAYEGGIMIIALLLRPPKKFEVIKKD